MHIKGFDIMQSINIRDKLQQYLNAQFLNKKARKREADLTKIDIIIDKNAMKNDANIDEMMYYWDNYLD